MEELVRSQSCRVFAGFCLLAVTLCSRSVSGSEPHYRRGPVRGHVGVDTLLHLGDSRTWPAGGLGTERGQAAGLPERSRRVPGEFEHQEALLLGCHQLVEDLPALFVEIVRQTRGKVSLVAMVSDVEEYQSAKLLLQLENVAADHVRFAEVTHDTLWARDYGPTIAASKLQGPVVLDARYDVARSNDDRVPEALARLLKLPLVPVPLTIEGGNLLTNGQGLAITTDQVFDRNVASDEDEQVLFKTLHKLYGFRQVITLEALAGESTGHVDMFATFTSPDTVLVGSYTSEQDAENAAILDRNAARLSQACTRKGPLRVIRIPMPPHNGGVWRTYTNVVYANGLVLVPVYPSLDPQGRHRAIETFLKVLPGWKVVGIDASGLIGCNGALHCISMNLGPIGKLPHFPEPQRARQPQVLDETELARRIHALDRSISAAVLEPPISR